MHKSLFAFFILFFLTAQGQTKSKSFPHQRVSDEKSFTPDGYYFPTIPVKVGNFELEWLSVFTQHANSSTAHIRLLKNGKWKEISAYNFKIAKDSSYFHFKSQPVGNITIIGKFTGDKGPSVDEVAIKKTIVFEGKIQVNEKSQIVKFTWWEGD